jgi:hypothetical protein
MLSIRWNKARRIWFPRWAGQAAKLSFSSCGALGTCSNSGRRQRRRCTASWDLYDARQYPREGGRGLSAKKQGESDEAGDSRRSTKSTARGKTAKKHRPGDLGRALRSVYDDTLRETIPDDFLNLIGKLS